MSRSPLLKQLRDAPQRVGGAGSQSAQGCPGGAPCSDPRSPSCLLSSGGSPPPARCRPLRRRRPLPAVRSIAAFRRPCRLPFPVPHSGRRLRRRQLRRPPDPVFPLPGRCFAGSCLPGCPLCSFSGSALRQVGPHGVSRLLRLEAGSPPRGRPSSRPSAYSIRTVIRDSSQLKRTAAFRSAGLLRKPPLPPGTGPGRREEAPPEAGSDPKYDEQDDALPFSESEKKLPYVPWRSALQKISLQVGVSGFRTTFPASEATISTASCLLDARPTTTYHPYQSSAASDNRSE